MRGRTVVGWLGAGAALAVLGTGAAILAVELAPAGSTTHVQDAAPAQACASARTVVARAPVARVGAYYFDGWAGPLGDAAFAGLVGYKDRQPLSGWRDNTTTSLERQLSWAHDDGIDFFVFDWYHLGDPKASPYLNNALDLYRRLPDHHGVGYAVMYVNTASGPNFVIPRSGWQAAVRQWVTQDFTSKDYARVDGEPLFIVYDVAGFTKQLGGPAGVDAALATLRRTARAHGLPGVFVAGSIDVNPLFDWSSLATFSSESFDAFTQYASPAAAGFKRGARPYGELVSAIERNWRRLAALPQPFIPSVTLGWDPRPWNETIAGALWWFQRTPSEVGGFVRAAVSFAANSKFRVEPPPAKPLVLLEAWNELGEGAYLVPTVGACSSYGNAVARALEAAP